MNNLHLNVPFVLLSTQVNRRGETEKRFLTPFGAIDVTFRKVPSADGGTPRFQIEVRGDTDNWVFCDSTMAEFKTTLLHFVRGIAQEHLEEVGQGHFDELCVHVKGAEVRLTGPPECGHRGHTNVGQPAVDV